MKALIVFIVITVLAAIIGAISQVLKNQQQEAQARNARARANRRAGSGEIDKFLEEIDRLRQKNAGQPATAKPPVARPAADVPTVAPAKSRRIAGEASFAPPVAPVARPVPTSRPRIDDLPVAPVVAAPAAAVARPAAAPGRRVVPPTEFARQLTGLLGSKQSLPMAVVLQEVLGPPKCRRG